jgi:hypothetical protein
MKRNIIGILFLVASQSFGWGSLGHRTVGLIADANLTPKAKASVQYLLNKQGLADVANWADSIKSGLSYKQTVRYHYEKIPAGVSYLQNLQKLTPEEKAQGGTIVALIVARDTLRNSMTTLQEKADALKFIAHFVGDIHQPLHSGRPDDRGGNDIPVTWFGESANLHKVWDTSMIYSGHKDILNQQMPIEQASLAYAKHLVKKTSREIIFVRSDLDMWIYEAIYLRESGGVYDISYANQQASYQAKLLPTLDNRVLVAGLRLADMVNQIFEGAPVPQAELTFRRQIEVLMGNIAKYISLKP